MSDFAFLGHGETCRSAAIHHAGEEVRDLAKLSMASDVLCGFEAAAGDEVEGRTAGVRRVVEAGF